MRTYDLQKTGGRGLCDALCHALRQDILSHRIETGERLPSKRRLAEHHGISVTTVQNAYDQLIAEGYIVARERSGYFAAALQSPPTPSAGLPLPPQSEDAPDARLLDLVTNRPRAEKFPFSIWARLMRRVISEERDRLLLPTPAAGVIELRRAIARYLQEERGMAVSDAQIVIGAGTEYLYYLLMQLLGRERSFALEDPCHKKTARIYAANGVKILPIPLDGEGVDMAALRAADADVLHLTPNHHFPTGVVTTVQRRQALLSYLYEREDRYLIEDDYDSEFRFTGRPIPPLYSLDGAGRVIYVNTFSMTIAPSVRISYMVLPHGLLPAWRERLGFYACPVPAFEQHILARFISEGYFATHLHRMRTFYRVRQKEVADILREAPFATHLHITEGDAGLHFLLRIKSEENDTRWRALLQKAAIRCAFLEDYCIDSSAAVPHTLVVNYAGVDPAELRAGLARVAALLESGDY